MIDDLKTDAVAMTAPVESLNLQRINCYLIYAHLFEKMLQSLSLLMELRYFINEFLFRRIITDPMPEISTCCSVTAKFVD